MCSVAAEVAGEIGQTAGRHAISNKTRMREMGTKGSSANTGPVLGGRVMGES